MKPTEKLAAKHIYKFLKQDWHIPIKKSEVSKTALSDLGFTEMEVRWLLNSIERKYQISINMENLSTHTSVELFIQKVLGATSTAAIA